MASATRGDGVPASDVVPRPLLAPAVGLIVGIAVSDAAGSAAPAVRVAAAASAVGLAAGLWWGGWRRRAVGGVVGTAAVAATALLCGFVRHQHATRQPLDELGRALTDTPVLTRVAGTIVSTPLERPAEKHNPFLPFDPPPRTVFVLAVEELRTDERPRRVRGALRVSVDAQGLRLRLGQRVQVTGSVRGLRPPRNPGEPDWAAIHRRQGLAGFLTVENSALIQALPAPDQPWLRGIWLLRGWARAALLDPFPADVADAAPQLLDTMILGQRTAADRALNEAFLRAGGLHFLAVSGLNVNLLAAATWWTVRRLLRRGPPAAALAALATTVLFALVTEPNAPVLRAAIVAGLAAAAALARRRMSAVNGLALAALLILLVNPQELFRAGFQLSFVLVLALVLLLPASWRAARGAARDEPPPVEATTLRGLAARWLGRGLEALALVSAGAWLVSIPLVLWHFGRLAPWGAFGTLLLTVPVTLVTICGFLTLLLGWVPLFGAVVGLLLRALTTALLAMVRWFTPLPAAVVECAPPPALLVALTYAALLALALFRQRQHALAAAAEPAAGARILRRTRRMALATLGGLVLAWGGWVAWPGGPAEYRLDVLAVGGGRAAVLTAPGGSAVILNAGTNTNSDVGETVVRALRAAGARRVVACVTSSERYTDFSGLPTLMTRRRVPMWLTGPTFPPPGRGLARLYKRLPPGAPPPTALHAGESRGCGPVRVAVLWPPRDGPRDRPPVVRAEAGGLRILAPGAVDAATVAGLLTAERDADMDLRADVLLLPRHGRADVDAVAGLVAAVAPRVVVVSATSAPPGLAPRIADILGVPGRLWVTGERGAVTVRWSPGAAPQVTAMRAPATPPVAATAL